MALGRRILAKPLNYIGTIDAGSRDLDQNLTRTGHRNRQIGQRGHLPIPVDRT
jgi:hypothetical protein